MSFITPFLFAPLLLLAATGDATPGDGNTGQACHQIRPTPRPEINIELFTPEPTYELGKSLKQLNAKKDESHAMWLKENGLDELWSHTDMQTQGQASSGWELSFSFRVHSKPLDSFGAYYCPFILNVDMGILLRTGIEIAREIPRGTCEYEHIDHHEYKHYQVNRYIVEQAVERLRADMPRMIYSLEMEGHVGRADIETRVEVMKQAISDAVSIYLKDEISREMKELNAKVDTPEEYDRVSKLRKLCRLKAQMKQKNKPQQFQKK